MAELSIMIVDDKVDIANGLEFLLQNQSREYRVVCKVRNAQDAIEKALSVHPDIIITDIRMPGMTGLEMMSALKEKGEQARFIILSGYPEFEYAKTAVQLGAVNFLTKPVDEDELFATIEKVRPQIELEKKEMELYSLTEKPEEPDRETFSAEALAALDHAMKVMDDAALETAVDMLFSELPGKEGLTSSHYRIIVLQLTRYAFDKQVGEESSLGMPSFDKVSYINRINLCRDLEDYRDCLLDALRNINRLRFQQLVPPKKTSFEEIQAYIQEHFTEDLSLNRISEQFYLNPVYISQLFKKKTGVGYKDYMTGLRIQRAKRLLEETDLRVYEICEMVGYRDIKYFNKTFEKLEGMTPSEYRKGKQTDET